MTTFPINRLLREYGTPAISDLDDIERATMWRVQHPSYPRAVVFIPNTLAGKLKLDHWLEHGWVLVSENEFNAIGNERTE